MRKHYFDNHHRSCPYCGKTRRAGYISACPECYRFLDEMKLQMKGLKKYMQSQGYEMLYRFDDTVLSVRLSVTVKGYFHKVDRGLSLRDIYRCSLPIEEQMSKEICEMCGYLVGHCKLW